MRFPKYSRSELQGSGVGTEWLDIKYLVKWMQEIRMEVNNGVMARKGSGEQ